MRTQLRNARVLGLCLSAVLACGDDAISPEMRAAAGTYVATQLVTTETNGTLTDQLAAGVSITLMLNADGTTSGQFVVPGEPTANLAGRWTLDGTTVRLSHAADTFLRDMDLQLVANALVGDELFGGTRVQVTLTKQ